MHAGRADRQHQGRRIPELLVHNRDTLGYARLKAYIDETFLARRLFNWDELAQANHTFAPTYLRHSVGVSLDRLGLSRLDCVFLEAPEAQRKIAPEWVADEATVWFQPCGNRTGLHHDSYNSVLTVIHGEKRVLLFTPEHHTKLYPCDVAGPTGFTRASWSQVDIFAPDHDAFPLLRDAEYSEVIVHAGETLSIPCNWWHAVENRGRPTIATSLFVVGQGKPEATFFRDRGMLTRFAYELGLAGGGKP